MKLFDETGMMYKRARTMRIDTSVATVRTEGAIRGKIESHCV